MRRAIQGPEKKGTAIPINLHLIEEIDSKVIMKRD
jgi:hypothetical protein